MNYVYGAGTMGFGNGYAWHRWFGYKFPKFPIVTKTVTAKKITGYPFAIIRLGSTVYNHVAHHNPGFSNFIYEQYQMLDNKNLIVSIAGTDAEIAQMVTWLDSFDLAGIQLSFSCPNVKDEKNKVIPVSHHPIYLKLNHKQDPYAYDLSRVRAIMVNSVPHWFGGMSGHGAQEKNWDFIRRYNYEGFIEVYGASWTCLNDVKYLEEYCGVKTCAIGSVMLTNPSVVESLNLI